MRVSASVSDSQHLAGVVDLLPRRPVGGRERARLGQPRMAASEIGQLALIAEDGRILQPLLDLREAALDLANEALHGIHAS